jgi:autophagy-related protein 27
MRRPQIRQVYAALYYAFLFPTLIVAATNFDCSKIVIDEKTKPWDLSKLGGPHSVTHSYETPPTISNQTFTIDICKDLELDDSVDTNHQCPSGTRGSPYRTVH